MPTNRRKWLQQMGMVGVGLGLGPLRPLGALAAPLVTQTATGPEDAPVRLSSNENPYGPSPAARAAMLRSIGSSNRYSWNTTGDLLAALAKRHGVGADNVLLGPGSTEILDLLGRLLTTPKGNFVVANPSYTSWTKAAELLGGTKKAVPLTADKRHDLPAMLAAIDADTKLVYVCNPNNPTGTVCDPAALAAFVRAASQRATVVVDEAYLDFTDQPSVVPLVQDNPRVVVVKTFSKIHGLAGARVGYAVAHKDTIGRLAAQQTWANGGVSVVSRAGALAALMDQDFAQQCRAQNQAARDYTVAELTKRGLTCIPSHTNFIYFSLATYQPDLFARLKSHNIEGTGIFEEAGKWTRITVGTMEEMRRFVGAVG